ncbi:MAG: carboxypeptidase-like regulatory domain-containing protein [Nitrospirota bacterium]
MKKYILFLLVIVSAYAIPVFAEEIDTGWISGQMMIKDGGPMAGGIVVFFKADEGPVPDHDRYFRIPNEIANLDNKGKFRIALPAGRYFMGAIKRKSGELVGPPQNGDYFFMSQDTKGNPHAYTVKKDQKLDIGIISKAVPFKRMVPKDVSGITGVIQNVNGVPLKGAIVFAYLTETMTGLPLFTSYRTGMDGKYLITMDRGGNYYLRVRDIYGGGPPVRGAIMGGYGQGKATAVNVKTGEITEGIDIKVIRHMDAGPKGRKIHKSAEKAVQQK